jgi:hypothetical protein
MDFELHLLPDQLESTLPRRLPFEDIEGLRCEIDELRTEVRALKLHLDLVHDCKGPQGD